MCTLRHCTCSLSDDLRKVWGMKGLGPFNHCIYNLYVRFPMKWSSYAYVVFSRTCVLSGTALVPFLTTSERCEGWKAWGLSTTVTITCMFVSQWNAPEKWSAYAYFLLPDGPWQIRRSEIEIMLNHTVCFPPNHVYSPALHMLFFTWSLSNDKINVFKVVF